MESELPRRVGRDDLYEWNNTILRFQIYEESDLTSRLNFVHVGMNASKKCFDETMERWIFYLRTSLKAYLHSGMGKPYVEEGEEGEEDEDGGDDNLSGGIGGIINLSD